MTHLSAKNTKASDLAPFPLLIMLAVFFALALFYSLIIPIFEGPDEDDHFRYAKFIADQGVLPVQMFEVGGGIAGHQGWQPPLYYALAAIVIAPIDKSDYEQHLWRNYAATFVGDPACCGRNIYFHTDAENFPYTQTTLAVHLARVLSILFGLVTVWAIFQIGRIFGDGIGYAAAGVAAFNPSFLFANALVSNDAPLAAFSALVLLLWVRLLSGKSELTVRSAGLLGASIAIALLIKTTALGLIPFSVLVLLVVSWRKRAWRLAVTTNTVMAAMIVLISGWSFVRNLALYGDPLAYRLMTVSALFPRSGPLTPDELVQISLPWLWQTFWGGPTPGDMAPMILIVLAAFTLLAFVGMLLFLARESQFSLRASLLFLGAWLGFILVAQVQFIRTTTGADQGRYLFPALAAFALFFALGLTTLGNRIAAWLTHRSRRAEAGSVVSLTIVSAFVALALFVPLAYTRAAYARPALLSESDLAHVPHAIQVNYGAIELRGYALDTRFVKPGDTLNVSLYWRALAPMSESYRVFVHLIGQGDRSAGGSDVIPARGAFPTVYWKPGDALRDEVRIPIALNSLPGKYALEVGLYPVGKPGERLGVVGSGDDRVLLDSIKVMPREARAFNPQTRVGANFDNKAELIGYDVTIAQANLQLALYWRARASMDRDYTVFVHVLDANGKLIAQGDQQPQNGNNPTSLWMASEQLRDDYSLALPPGAKVGRIQIGLYSTDTNERLPVLDERGAPRDDNVLLDVQP